MLQQKMPPSRRLSSKYRPTFLTHCKKMQWMIIAYMLRMVHTWNKNIDEYTIVNGRMNNTIFTTNLNQTKPNWTGKQYSATKNLISWFWDMFIVNLMAQWAHYFFTPITKLARLRSRFFHPIKNVHFGDGIFRALIVWLWYCNLLNQ